MSKSDFFGLMEHPEWQKRRLEVLSGSDFTCEVCGDNQKRLDVHHKIYRVKTKPWEYNNDELACLCKDCHEEETARVRQIREVIFLDAYERDVDLVVAAIAPYEPEYLREDKELLLRAETIKKCCLLYGQDLIDIGKLADKLLSERKLCGGLE